MKILKWSYLGEEWTDFDVLGVYRKTSEKTYFKMIWSRLDLVKWLKLKIKPNFNWLCPWRRLVDFQVCRHFLGL